MVLYNTLTLTSFVSGLVSNSQAADGRRYSHLAFKSHFHAGALKHDDIAPSGPEINQTLGCTSQLRILACKPASSMQQPPRKQQRRRRRLRQEDSVSKVHRSEHYWDPYLEKQIRRVRDQGMHINDDVERLKLQRENKFELILELAEQANEFLVNHPEEAIHKKPTLKVIADAVNQTGTAERAEAYMDATFEFLEELGMF